MGVSLCVPGWPRSTMLNTKSHITLLPPGLGLKSRTTASGLAGVCLSSDWIVKALLWESTGEFIYEWTACCNVWLALLFFKKIVELFL